MKYYVFVKPGAKVEKITESPEGLVVFLHARAHDGEANASLLKLLAKHFKVAKTQIKIVSGEKSRKKVVEIPEN